MECSTKNVRGDLVHSIGMTMVKMTGDQLVLEIMKIRPDVPVILSTGFNERIDEEKAKQIGIRQYLEKPLNRCFLAKNVYI